MFLEKIIFKHNRLFITTRDGKISSNFFKFAKESSNSFTYTSPLKPYLPTLRTVFQIRAPA